METVAHPAVIALQAAKANQAAIAREIRAYREAHPFVRDAVKFIDGKAFVSVGAMKRGSGHPVLDCLLRLKYHADRLLNEKMKAWAEAKARGEL